MSQAGEIDVIGTHPEIPVEFIANVGSAVPIANQLEVLGEVVAAGTNPFRSIASGNTVTYQVQIAQAIASTNATNIGLAAFNSSDFIVDANGFVSISATAGGTSFTVDAATAPGTNPVAPTVGGIVTVTGGQVAAGTTANVIRTNSLSASTYTIEIQRSSAQAVSTVGSNGVSHFDSASFGVGANGFVTLLSSALGVLSVSGTANRITSTGGQNPVIDIAATYVGQTSITTLGTITTGVWNGSVIPLAFGGTNANLTASNGGIFYSTATAGAILAGTATANQMLLSGASTTPAWSSATHPATVAQGDLLYGSATNVYSNLTKNTTATRYLANTGTNNNPNWDQVTLTTGASDYTTGTFTPTVTGSLSNPTVVYTSQVGSYTRIGNIVFFQVYVSMSTFTGGTGLIQISSLPFTCENVTNHQYMCAGTWLQTNYFRMVCNVLPNTTDMIIFVVDGAISSAQTLPAAAISEFRVSGFYRV